MQSDKFDTIQCHRLEVVDADGKPGVILTVDDDGGRVEVLGKDGKVKAGLGVTEHGDGLVGVRGKDGKSKAALGVNEHGDGGVEVYDKLGKRKFLD